MSKFLKFIVHLIMICTIVCVLGLVLPPFFGINTVIVDDADMTTNLPVGSVTYAIPEKAADVYVGESSLVQDEGNTYCYDIATVDLGSKTGTVTDPDAPDKVIPVNVHEYVPRVVITIPYLGYLQVATQSVEGMIILGLAVVFLIILYIIATLWEKDPHEEEYEDDPAAGYVKTQKELKREEKEKAKLLKEEERQIKNEDRSRKKKKKAEKRMVRTGGFVDEIEDDDYEEEEPLRPVEMQSAASEAHEVLKKEIAAATADEVSPLEEITDALSETRTVVEDVKDALKANKQEKELEEAEPVQVKKRAIPGWTASQLADIARELGDSPEIVKDDITEVTLFDYSDLFDDLAGEDEEE